MNRPTAWAIIEVRVIVNVMQNLQSAVSTADDLIKILFAGSQRLSHIKKKKSNVRVTGYRL